MIHCVLSHYRVAISLIVATVYIFVVDNDPADGGGSTLPTDDTPIDLNVEHSLLQVSFPIKKGFNIFCLINSLVF